MISERSYTRPFGKWHSKTCQSLWKRVKIPT